MKWLLRGLIAFSVLIIFILALCFTHTGNVLLWEKTKIWLPQLSGELVEGHLGKGLSIKNLAWDDQQVTFKTDKLTIAWNPSWLMHKRLWITQIEASNPVITLPDSGNTQATPQDENTETAPFSLPLAVDIDHISITGFRLLQNTRKVTFSEFTTGLQLNNNGLTINNTFLNHLDIQPEASPDQPSATTKKAEKGPVQLPDIELPFPVKLKKLQLVNTHYEKEVVPNINLSLEGVEHRITIHDLDIIHSLANARLSGKISLEGVYPLELVIDSTLKQALTGKLPEPQTLNAVLSGSLNELQANIKTYGSINAAITGTVSPIQQQLPFDLKLSWEPLQWPLSGNTPDIHTEKGELTFQGDLSGYHFNLNTQVQALSQPPATVTLTGEGDTGQLTLDKATIQTAEGNATITGHLDWRKNIGWQGQLDLAGFNPSFWVPELPGQLNGKIKHHFSYADNQWSLALPEIAIKGQLRDQPITVTGQVTGNNHGRWRFNDLVLAAGDNTITTHGEMTDTWAMTMKLDGPNLKQLYPGLKGSIKGQVELTGNQVHPSITYNLHSPSLTWQQFALSELHSSGTLAKGEEYGGKVTLRLKHLHNGTLALNNIQLNADGVESDHQLSLTSEGTPLATNLMLSGSLKDTTWQGTIKQAQLNTQAGDWVLQQPLQITLNKEQTALLSSQCWQSGDAALCFEPATLANGQGHAAFSLSQFNLDRLKPFYPEQFSWQATLAGQGQLHWNKLGEKIQPELSLQLTTTPGTLETESLKHNYEALDVQIELSEQTLNSHLSFLSKRLGQADVTLSVADIEEKRLLNGQLNIQGFMVNVLTPFVPEVRQLEGIFSAKGRFGGSLDNPLFYGDLALNKGGVETTQDIVSINQLNTLMTVSGTSATLKGMMKVGDGTLYLGGAIDWKTLPPAGQITIKGHDLDVQYPGIGEVRVQPDLIVNIGQQQSLTGTISIPWSRIKIESLPQHAIKRSDDIIIIQPGKADTAKEELAAPLDVKIQVQLGDDVQLDAFGLQTHLQGGLGIIQQPEKPLEIHGTIKLEEGRYRSLGQNLVIRKGDIIFSGPPGNPYLVLEAIRNPEAIEDNVTVGVMVNGPVAKPEWTLFSDPTMPQAEQFSYLLRGRGMNATAGDNSALQSMLLGLGVNKFGGFVSDIGEAVGIKDVTLDTEGSGDDTQVTVSGYVSPKIQVQYGVGVFSSVGEVKVKYELMPQLYLQAISGLAQALDIFYRFSL